MKGDDLIWFDPTGHGKLRRPPADVRLLPPMPITSYLLAGEVQIMLELVNSVPIFRFAKIQPARVAFLNPTMIRKDFFAVRTPADALTFLQSTGSFAYGPDRSYIADLSWHEFQDWQTTVRAGLLYGSYQEPVDGAADLEDSKIHRLEDRQLFAWIQRRFSPEIFSWFAGRPPLEFGVKPEAEESELPELRASLNVKTTLDAVLAANYLDRITGKRYELCALPECLNLYEVTSKQPRQYCSNAHAHRAAVRRKAAAVKAAFAS